MRFLAAATVPLLVALTAACSGSGPDQQNSGQIETGDVATVEKSKPNYFEKEGYNYIYQAGLSEDDKNAGRTTGTLITFRYLGKEGDLFTLADIGSDGQVTGRNQCKNPCKIIKMTSSDGTKDQMAYQPESLIGSAFDDAFNGHLEIAGAAKPTH